MSIINRVEVPRGRVYKIQLPDGSKVWLNSASAIKFPTTFTQEERHVQLVGEAYFEIVENAALFFVESPRQQIIALGAAHVNINAYAEEKILYTTVFHGKVEIQRSDCSALILPFQQGLVSIANKSIVVQHADLSRTIAWKNGYFEFENATIWEVMQQFSRWYDMDLAWKKVDPSQRFAGRINRSTTLNIALNILRRQGINIHLEQNTKSIVVLIGD